MIKIFRGGATMSSTPDWVITSSSAGQFGTAVSVGRFRGAAFPPSIAVSEPNFTVGGIAYGRVWIFNAPVGGLPTATTTAGANQALTGSTANEVFGKAIASCGNLIDEKGDCLAIGVTKTSTGGRVSIFNSSGTSSGLNGPNPIVSRTGNNNGTGVSCNGQFGTYIANAHNVDNSDSAARDDLLVGDPACSHGNAAEGKIFLYTGFGVGGLTTSSWTFEVDQDGAALGPVAALGDVTGDGIPDFAVGAPKMDNGSVIDAGRVYVFKGAAGAPTTTQVVSMSTSFPANCGTSIAGGVDINRDGYMDMIVGEPAYSNGVASQGRVRVFYGMPGTMNFNPATTIVGGNVGRAMGTLVGVGNFDGKADGSTTSGDVYGDVLIGLPGYNAGSTSGVGEFIIRQGAW
jgi:hypothetical protein